MCSHFKGVEGRESIASIDCTGTLFEQFETALHFLTSRLSHSFTIKGPRREETLEIPLEAIREALLNAIVHRNYHLKNSIKIAIYDNRVEFFSPGTLPGPFDLQNIESGISFIRNMAICKVFRKSGYIEKLGSGFTTIFSSYAKRGLQRPSIIEGANFVKCTLPRGANKKELPSGNDPILKTFETSPQLTISDVVEIFHVPRATAGRKLNALVTAGKLRKIGKGRGTYYVLAIQTT